MMHRAFFIVGPTAVGKSEIAAETARISGAEVLSADAFQVYRGLDLLTAKPDAETLARARHHLIGNLSLGDEMNAEKFRRLALHVLQEIEARGRTAIIAGGSGLYIKALTHGLDARPAAHPGLRADLNALSLDQLRTRLIKFDPNAAETVDLKNRRRVTRALEICLLTGKPISLQPRSWKPVEAAVPGGRDDNRQAATGTAASTRTDSAAKGVVLIRDRADLNERINRRVSSMFASGVVEEVRAIHEKIGATAAKALGLHEIRQLLAGEISEASCISAIQQATRRYAKRQLTWFRRQTTFPVLNLSLQSPAMALEWMVREARLTFAPKG